MAVAPIPTATKIRILFFSPSIAGYSQGEESRRLGTLHLMRRRKKMKKLIAILLFAFASGCAASGASRYRPCHELRTDMSVSNVEFERRCPRDAPD
jgi:hypothetical protein